MESGTDTKGRQAQAALFFRCLAAFLFVRINTILVNTSLYPRIEGIIPVAREISTIVFIATVLALTVLALLRPRSIRRRVFLTLSIASIILGAMLTLAGLRLVSPVLIVLGTSCMDLGGAWVFTVVGLALLGLDVPRAFFCIAFAFIANFLVQMFLIDVPAEIMLVLYLVATCITVALVGPVVSGILDTVAASGDTPADLSITHPFSFLPLSHSLFVSFFIFSVGFGFALTYGSEQGTPPTMLFSTLPLILIVATSLLMRQRMNIDRIYLIAILLVVAGYLAIPTLPKNLPIAVPNTLVFAGSECFALVMWTVLIAIGKRNILGALPILTFGSFANSFGTIIGTSLGHLTNGVVLLDARLEPLIAAVIIFSIIVYCLITARSFSFEGTVEGIEPVMRPTALDAADAPDVADAPDALDALSAPDALSPLAASSERLLGLQALAEYHRLTPRELDILKLLASGRNVRSIQEELYLSRNTIKTHIKNIYTKLDVHSQPELMHLCNR